MPMPTHIGVTSLVLFVISIHSIQLEFVVEANLSMYLPFEIFFALSHCKIENGVYLMRILNQTRSRQGQALVPESYGWWGGWWPMRF